MTRVVVLGAGVIGSTYAALLAHAGHAVTLVARGSRAEQLRRDGVRVDLDGVRLAPPLEVTDALTTTPDVLLVAVRGDQLDAALPAVEACAAPLVLMLANPVGLRAEAERRIGRHRLVWGFAGLGGGFDRDEVVAHRVAQQPTMVEDGRPGSRAALALLRDADPRTRAERDMEAWLDTHSVFIAAMAAVLLGERLDSSRERRRAATRLVRAVREGFDVLAARGKPVRPRNLRLIFGPVPTPLASRYWAAALARPVVEVSMRPHALATRTTEQPVVAAHALTLVGAKALRYRALVGPLADPGSDNGAG